MAIPAVSFFEFSVRKLVRSSFVISGAASDLSDSGFEAGRGVVFGA